MRISGPSPCGTVTGTVLAGLMLGGCGQPSPEAFTKPVEAIELVETNIQALQAWAASRARADVLVHIDAVDDMAVFPPAMSETMRNVSDYLASGDASVLDRIAAYVENGGTVNLGHGAGLYRRVIWVVPAPGSVTGAAVDNFRAVLEARRGFSPADLADLRASGDQITGSIGGVPLTVTSLEDLEIAGEHAILDIDLGWFVGRQSQDPSYRPGTASLLTILRMLAGKRIPTVYVTVTRGASRQGIPLDTRYFADVIKEVLRKPEVLSGPVPEAYAAMIQAEEAIGAGRYQEAEALYAELTARRGDMAGLHFAMGITEGFLGKQEESRQALLQAYQLDPGYLRGFFQLARVLAGRDLVEAGEYLLATPDLVKIIPAVEMDYQKGLFYLGAGRPYDAVTFLGRVAARSPDDFALRTVLLRAYEDIGDPAEVIRILEDLLSIDTARVERDMPWVYKRLGELAEEAGMTPRAAEVYRRYLELVPDDEDAPRMRAIVDQRDRPRSGG